MEMGFGIKVLEDRVDGKYWAHLTVTDMFGEQEAGVKTFIIDTDGKLPFGDYFYDSSVRREVLRLLIKEWLAQEPKPLTESYLSSTATIEHGGN